MIIKIDNTNKEMLEKISFLEKEIFPESYYSITTLQEMCLKKEYSIIVYDEDVKGYLILHDSYDVYEIMKIAVTTNFRNRKIGQELINFYLEEFNKNLLLEVRETNEIARRFYEKLGFVNIGKRKNYYSNGETAILMSLERN